MGRFTQAIVRTAFRELKSPFSRNFSECKAEVVPSDCACIVYMRTTWERVPEEMPSFGSNGHLRPDISVAKYYKKSPSGVDQGASHFQQRLRRAYRLADIERHLA